MNVKNNKRRQASQEKIESVFIDLLQEKEISQITVSDICQKTGLNRSTFYANYDDVYNLADRIKDKLEQYVDDLYENDVTNKCGVDYLILFRFIKDNQRLFNTYFKLGYDNNHKVNWENLNFDLVDSLHGEHIEYHVEFHKAGLNAIIKKWLASGCKESPETMVKILEVEYGTLNTVK